MRDSILITGAMGNCGTALMGLSGRMILLDRRPGEPAEGDATFLTGEVSDRELLRELLAECRAVIHLAAAPNPDDPWATVQANNIDSMAVLLAEAKTAGIERVIFASTNHVVGMYELDHAPEIYEPDHPLRIDHLSPVRPDSYYGVSKVFGEALGRYHAENGGPRFYAVRIGSVRAANEDHPFAYAEQAVREDRCQRGDTEYVRLEKRLKALWQSRRDFKQMIELLLKYDGPRFDVFYGISDNARAWLDLDHAHRMLGYQPRDHAEMWSNPPAQGQASPGSA